jgi:hypothetical protein
MKIRLGVIRLSQQCSQFDLGQKVTTTGAKENRMMPKLEDKTPGECLWNENYRL